MANKKQAKGKRSAHQPPQRPRPRIKRDNTLLPWLLVIAGVTAVCLAPMLRNEFVNWDDEYYVINNPLLRGPDLIGIFSEPVLGNYHPLTILSYSFNYAISKLDPFSYLLVNYLFHLANTLLVFHFIWNISGKNRWVAAFVALVFGKVEQVIHQQVRKDVLYTFFFLLSLIQYWKFLETNKEKHFWTCFILFVLSLLSKPAAIVLPLVLLLLDYWKGRSFTSKVFTEKIIFFVLSFSMGVATFMIQSPSAMAGLNVFSITDRLLFACYSLMTYFIRFFIPYPMSALHPFPITNKPGWQILVSPAFVAVLLTAFWFLRRNKVVVFGLLFYVVNLLLVLQVVSIGLAIVSERYTYVPYIGLAFMFAMLLSKSKVIPSKISVIAGGVFLIIMGFLCFQRTKVWKNSGTLWSDALKTYPRTPYARTNRANYLSKLALRPDKKAVADSIYKVAMEDCAIALEVRPTHTPAFEYRGLMYLDRQQYKEALADANELIRLKPEHRIAYDMRATAHYKLNDPQKALADYDKCTQLKPDDHRSYNNKGTLYMNAFQKYDEAIAEFNKAINIQPVGYYFLNRSICYFKMNNIAKAREDAIKASQLGTVVTDSYKASLQLK